MTLNLTLSQQIADCVREAMARRRITRRALADQARISVSTLEKALAGDRPFGLASLVRIEQAPGISLRAIVAFLPYQTMLAVARKAVPMHDVPA